MKEFLWRWLFWASTVFFGLLVISLLIAYSLYSASPDNEYTPIFACGFGFMLGFIGLGSVTLAAFDKLNTTPIIFSDTDNETFNRVLKEAPFFFFALQFFFSFVIYMGLFLLVLSYVRNSFV